MSTRREVRLFEGGAPHVRAAPPSAAFLVVLAERLAVDLANPDDPFALADATVLLPNRRAVRGLIDAFANRTPGASLLPAIKPLGDLDDDPDMWGPAALDMAIPPAIDPLRRRLHLAALLRRRDVAEGGAPDPVRAIAAADELAKLLDAASASDGVDWSKLVGLVEDRDLAAHWRRSVEFLEIVALYWPLHLAEAGLSDPGERRNLRLDALAAAWTAQPPRGPVVIAGSTGSLPAVRRLMRVVANLPRGAVILPGLDADLDDAAWAALGPQHPQFGLRATLEALGMERMNVPVLAGAAEDASARARRVLVREALVPADATADWLARLARAGGEALAHEALAGLSRVAAETEDEEACVIALALRAALETPEKTAALVTPDAGLARRVAAKLARWNVAAAPSAGLALRETPLGLLLLLIADLAVDDAEPRALAALVGNGRVGLGLSPADRAAAASAVIDQLRGPRRALRLEALVDSAAPLAGQAFAAIAAALAPIKAVLGGDEVDLSRLAEALADAAEAIAACPEDPGGAQVWAGSQGAAAVRALRALAAEGGALDAVAPDDAPRALGALIGSAPVAPEGAEHPRLAIWGPLEARLQRRDLIVLAGLNEGVWPAPPPDDPFLSRAMRADLGLVSPDVRIGLAAHDFAQLACAPEVLLTRAKRANGAPTVASRWLWRLETLAAGAGVADRLDPQTDWLALARALDSPAARAPAPPPKPKPPVSARPKSLRVTQVETLIRDPYAIYAGVILRLTPRDAVGAAAGARERGTAIHEALETFTREVDPRSEEAPAQLLSLVDAALERAGFTRDARQIDSARLQRAAEAFAQWAAARANAGGVVFIEAPGRLDLGDGYFLRCRADRIERDQAGAWTIVDYKTGAASSAKQVSIGLAPQLPLEAAILDAGGFQGEAHGRATSLVYWRFGGADPGVVDVSGPDPAGLADQTRANVRALFDAYANPNQPYLCKPRAQFIKERADFDALARRKEWADAEGAQ